MCGFAGSFSLRGAPVRDEVVRAMGQCMYRRGPDDDGFHSEGPIAMAFRRLSILDLSPAGHQPFTSGSGELTIVFNGEIFNYLELRKELIAKGHQFRSEGDTEVLLAAYVEWGVECLPRLNGMWAFLIYDRKRNLVFGARDRFGIKPLYRSLSDEVHYFASEIKALQIADRRTRDINWRFAAQFLETGRLDNLSTNHRTFFNYVQEVPPGSAFTIAVDGAERAWKFWSLPSAGEMFEGDVVATFADLFEDAVRLRLRSDVPVGVALSGGMDSSSIISIMGRALGTTDGASMRGRLNAFSYTPDDFDEEKYVRDTIALTGATLHRTSPSAEEMWNTLPAVLDAHDEPLHATSALAGYQVYQLAANAGVRVVLGGQGADETIGGYTPFFSETWLDLVRGGHLMRAIDEVKAYAKVHKQPVAGLLRALMIRFMATTIPRPRSTAHRPGMYAAVLSGDARTLNMQAPHERLPVGLHNVLAHSVEEYPLPLYLRIEDRNSMAHSVEARLPFLDYRLVTFAFQLENSWKIRGPWNKYVLRSAMKGVVPESVRTRVDKMGFPTGFSAWIRGPLKPMVEDALQSGSLAEVGIMNVAELRRLFQEHLSGHADHGSMIFNALQFAEWQRIIKAR
ncbi:MAG: asparagine synthase (glutamine-hydrolyzing) [Gemmatimonas sp.]